MDKTIYFILSKQSHMQTGLYFQLVVVTKCKQYFHVSSTLSALVLYYSISHCSPKKTHFISQKAWFFNLIHIFYHSQHILSFSRYVIETKYDEDVVSCVFMQLCLACARRVSCIFFTLFISYLNQRKYVKTNTLLDESAQPSALRQTTPPRTRALFTVCIIVVVRGSFIDSKTLTVVRLTYLSI